MEAQLKHRVAGAVILLSLAIILIPLLLDGDAAERQRLMTAQPQPPVIDLEPLDVRQVGERIAARAAASDARMPKQAADHTDYAAADNFALDKNNLPVGWSLQVGSFRDKANAGRLLRKLRAADHRAYVHQAGRWYRVYVGPMVDREALQAIGKQAQRLTGEEGRLVRYNIDHDREQLLEEDFPQ